MREAEEERVLRSKYGLSLGVGEHRDNWRIQQFNRGPLLKLCPLTMLEMVSYVAEDGILPVN